MAPAVILPDPGQPSVIPLCAVLGAFLGGAIPRMRRRSEREVQRAAVDGAFFGTASGLIIYLALLAAGV
jgi:hypothetical protein